MNYRLVKADCIDWMDSQEEKTVDSIITSPPYNLDIKYGKYKDDLPRQSYLKWMNDVAVSMKKVLNDEGHIFLNVGMSNTDPWVAMDVAQVFRQHFVLQNNFTWVKHIVVDDKARGIYKPISSNRYVSLTTEQVFHFTKDGTVPVDRIAIGHRNQTHEKYPELYSESRHIAEQRRKASRRLDFKTWLDFKENATKDQWTEFDELMIELEKKKPWDPDKKKCIGNAWFIEYTPISKLAKESGSATLGDRESGRGGHPATFPEALPTQCIKFSGIKPGSVVYDPFNGTGTTIVSAVKMGMKGVGTDIDQSYLDFAKNRINHAIKEIELPKNKLFDFNETG